MTGPFDALRRHAGQRLWLVGALMLLAAIAETVGIVAVVPLVTLAVGETPHPAITALFDPVGLPPTLESASLLFALAIAVRLSLSLVRDRQSVVMIAAFEASLGEKVAAGLLAAPWSEAAALGRGGVQARLGDDVARVAEAASRALTIFVLVILLAIQFAAAFILSPPLALLAFGIGLAIIALLLPYLKTTRSFGRQLGNLYDEQQEGAQALYSSLKSAAAEGSADHFIAAYGARLSAMAKVRVALDSREAGARAWILGLASAAALAIVWIGGRWLALDGAILVASLLLFARMTGPLQAIQQAIQQYVSMAPAYDRVADFTKGAVTVQPAGRADWHRLEAENLAARLPSGDLLFDEVSFVLVPGQWLGIGGPSGSGKTSLVDMVAGLSIPAAGTIEVDGKPLAGLSGWASQLAYCGPASAFASGTLRDNLSLDPAVDDKARYAALESVGMSNADWPWPAGLDSRIGESGPALSAGERQRLNLARALLRKPRLLILDEALSMLDAPAASALISKIRQQHPDLAVLLIAHREDLLDACDSRLRLDSGRALQL